MSLFDVIMKDQQFLTEASVYRGNSINLIAAPDDGRNYSNMAYFKMYDNESLKTVKRVWRIKFNSPELITSHKSDPHGAKVQKSINGEYRDLLIKILNSTTKDGKLVWIALIEEFNKYTPVQYNLPLNLEMPDYSRLR